MFMRTSIRIVRMAIVLFAAFATWRSTAQKPQAPAAPPGGVNLSKLPDTEGIRLGMTVEQATAVMKTLFPGDELEILYSHYAKDKMWISSLRGHKGAPTDLQTDAVTVNFSMPPNPQQVVYIERGLNLVRNPPTMENTVALLRKKYGQELANRLTGPGTLTWAYDEQGQPANPQGPSNWSPADCAGQTFGVTSGQPLPGQGLEVGYVLGPVPLAEQLPHLTADLCNRNVYVTAQLLSSSIQGTPVVGQIVMHLGEKPLMLRNAVAGQQHLDGQATAKKQQEMKTAQQQKAPTL